MVEISESDRRRLIPWEIGPGIGELANVRQVRDATGMTLANWMKRRGQVGTG